MRSLGFTGTQIGMTPEQKESVILFLESRDPETVHHGDCIGADAQFHHLAIACLPSVRVVIHPPKISAKRAFCPNAHEMRPKKDYLARNVDIVDESEEILAIPKEFQEETRSGTWFTVRQARKRGKGVYIIYPDGKVVHEQSVPSLFG